MTMAYFHAVPNHAILHTSNNKHNNSNNSNKNSNKNSASSYTSSYISNYSSSDNSDYNSNRNCSQNCNYSHSTNSCNYHSNCSSTTLPVAFNHLYSFGHPAFTEAAFVSCQSDAALKSVRRLSYEGHLDQDHWADAGSRSSELAMDSDAGAPALQRSASHQSNASAKSSRSQTVRNRKHAPYMSSSASSISDKSLTSFPSFSPESPRNERPVLPQTVRDSSSTSRHPSIVESLTASLPSKQERTALFGDAPPSTRRVPGAIHNASDEHIERLIARTGAVALVRQIAEDLAQRDAEVAPLRRKAENRERALRKIILECGLSSLDLETRLRAIEAEQRLVGDNVIEGNSSTREGGLEDLMSDAMSQTVVLGERAFPDNDNTIRAKDSLQALEDKPVTTTRGWKDYIWGGTTRKSSRSSVVTQDIVNGLEPSKTRSSSTAGRRTILEDGLFEAPESIRSASRASSIQSTHVNQSRKPSSGFAALALKLVAGSNTTTRDNESTGGRGRSNSTGGAAASRDQSSASTRTTMSARPAPVKQPPKPVPNTRRPAALSIHTATIRGPQERWDTMGQSPQNTRTGPTNNFGPVEMDQILPPDAQPPTLTHIYNAYSQEYLTDRFGFIYDQRRKKRQKEAAEKVIKSKRGSRVEMLNSSRGGRSPGITDDEGGVDEERPDTPTSLDERGEDGKRTKRWQDYLKIATFPTELLSHTPSGAEPVFEVMEGSEVPRSPRIITKERGFLPSSTTTAASPSLPVTSGNATISKPSPSLPVTSRNATISKPDTSTPSIALTTEDMEPVKLLLRQLGEVHDSLQRDKTVRWNEFLRKVRAERKRDGEAAAAALAATGDKNTRPVAIMPEAVLADGEMIGVAGLGNKGKVGRAKWNEFKALVLGGIPVAYRAKIWSECSGAAALRIPGYYDDLVARRGGDDDPAIIAQIQMDINRTLTDNIFFRKGPGVSKLEEVLLAYSRRNAEVGYCQGMNLITACLLLIMPTAEDAFWVLTSIIETILPQGYYDHSLLASRADQQVLRQYVAEILPKLSAHLDDLSIELEALTFQWFLSVFTDCLSAEALFRVWDVVFCTNDGSTFLFQVALALLKLNEQQLLQCSTPASIYTYINHQMTNHAISIDGLIHASEGLRRVVKRDEVEIRRVKAIESEKDLVRQREARNALRKAEKLAAANGCAKSGTQTEAEGIKASPLENGTQLGSRSDECDELRARTPTPAEEEAVLGMG